MLEPCPVCEGAVEIRDPSYSHLAYARCLDHNCFYCGPIRDPDGSKHNRLSLDARLGQMVRKHNIVMGNRLGTSEIHWKAYVRGGIGLKLGGPFDSYDEAIRDAWITLREGK